MTLEEIANGAPPVLRPLIGGDKQLTRQIQARLGACGLLDPPADGAFGPVSHWALEQFMRRLDLDTTLLDAKAAAALLDPINESDAFPLNFGSEPTWAERVAQAMLASDHWLCRHPECFNIVYAEGADTDGASNVDAANEFNDVRLILRVNRNGRAVIDEAWEATTEPGHYYTKVERLNPRGAARIAFGQYKAWSIGQHPRKSASSHEALVQTADVKVFRDFDENFDRQGDEPEVGMFGINQHWGYDMPRSDIGKASAGCLVGRTRSGHRSFMKLVKEDPRFGASSGYRFMATILDAATIE